MLENRTPLATEISELKDQHAADTFERRKADQEQVERADAMFVLGRIKQTGHLAQALAANLSAQEIRALEQFQKERMYRSLGFETFDDFLDSSPYASVTKRQYYDRLSLVRKHGDEIYDLLTSMGISIRAQKLLGTGELAIRNDTLVVGDREVEIGKDVHVVKEALNELFEEKRDAVAEKDKLAETVEKQKQTIKRGQAEFDELRRNYDALLDDTPFAKALMKVVGSVAELREQVRELPEAERLTRGQDDLQMIASLYFQLREAYGVETPLAQPVSLPANATLEEKIAAELAKDDDFGDE